MLDAYLRIGALEQVKEEAERALAAGTLEGRSAVQLAYALRSFAPETARQMLRASDLSSMPDALSGALLSLSGELGLGDIQDDMVKRLMSLPQQSGVVRSFETVEQVIEEINKLSEAYKDKLSSWLLGKTPGVLAMASDPKDYVTLYLADPALRRNRVGDDLPMFLSSAAAHNPTITGSNGKKPELRVDLGALLLGHRLGILDAVETGFEIWLPESLPEALVELGAEFGEADETLISTILSIKRGESAVAVVDEIPEGATEIATFRDEEDAVDRAIIGSVLSRAFQAGHITGEQLDRACAALGIAEPWHAQSGDAPVLVLSGMALAELNKAEIAEQAARSSTIMMRCADVTQLVRRIDFVRDEERIGAELDRLRKIVADKLRSGAWKTVTKLVPDDEGATTRPSHVRCLLEVFPRDGAVQDLLWMEDRMLSGAAAANTITVIPLVAHLVKSDRMSPRQESEIRTKLRKWGYAYLKVDAEEMLQVLRRSAVVGGRVIENDELGDVRRWFAREVANLRYTDQNLVTDQTGRVVGEARRSLELLSLAEDLLELVWSAPELELSVRRALSDWLWSNLRMPYLPDPPGNITPPARQLLVSMGVASAISMPLQMLLHQRQIDIADFSAYFEWLQAEVLDALEEGDNNVFCEALDHVASMLSRILEDNSDVDAELARLLNNHMLRLVRTYLSLPQAGLVEQLVKMRGLANKLPRSTTMSLTVTSELSIPLRSFEDAIAQAIAAGSEQATATARFADAETRVRLSVRHLDDGKVDIDVKHKRQKHPLDDGTTAVVFPDEATRIRLFKSLSHRDDLGEPITDAVAERLASEPDTDKRAQAYIDVLDNDFGRRIALVGKRIRTGEPITVDDFDLPGPRSLIRFLGLPDGFEGRGAELARVSAEALVKKVGMETAAYRLSSLPIEPPHDMLLGYAALISQGPVEPTDSAGLIFMRTLALASHDIASANDFVSNIDPAGIADQLKIFKQLLRRAAWQAARSEEWRALPPETALCLMWLHADQFARIAAPIGQSPDGLEVWFARQTPVRLVDLHRYREIERWVHDALFRITSTGLIASFAAKLLGLGVALPDQLKAATGRADESGFTPFPDVTVTRCQGPEEYWQIDDPLPIFVREGWIATDSFYAKRDPAEVLRIILSDDFGGDPKVYVPMTAILVSIEAIDDNTTLESLVARLEDTIDNGLVNIDDQVFGHFLDILAETHSTRRQREAFQKAILGFARAGRDRWPQSGVRLDDSEAGKVAVKLLNACYIFGSTGPRRTLKDRLRDVTETMRALVEAWPGIRLPVLAVLDELAAQVDAQTASDTVWPAALELRAG